MHSDHPKSRWVSLRRNKRGHNIPAWKVSWRSTRLLLAVLVTALPLALSAGAAQQQTFGRLFPELPPYHAPDDTALDALTVAGTTPALSNQGHCSTTEAPPAITRTGCRRSSPISVSSSITT